MVVGSLPLLIKIKSKTWGENLCYNKGITVLQFIYIKKSFIWSTLTRQTIPGYNFIDLQSLIVSLPSIQDTTLNDWLCPIHKGPTTGLSITEKLHGM